MRRTGQSSREPALFDLPLRVDPEIADEADRLASSDSNRLVNERSEVSVKNGLRREAKQIDLLTETPAAVVLDDRSRHLTKSLIVRRFTAGVFDTTASAGALAVLIVGAGKLGVPATVGDWPAFLLTMLEFSFIYVVFSVTFWGRTPGMVRARLTTSGHGDNPVSSRQAALRWLGGLVTVSLLGLPTLLTLRGRRSPADLLSGSRLSLS